MSYASYWSSSVTTYYSSQVQTYNRDYISSFVDRGISRGNISTSPPVSYSGYSPSASVTTTAPGVVKTDSPSSAVPSVNTVVAASVAVITIADGTSLPANQSVSWIQKADGTPVKGMYKVDTSPAMKESLESYAKSMQEILKQPPGSYRVVTTTWADVAKALGKVGMIVGALGYIPDATALGDATIDGRIGVIDTHGRPVTLDTQGRPCAQDECEEK